MRKLRAQIARFAPTRLPALVQGPTGSGKELVARALHAQSGRSGPFVAFNVCAVSDAMFEDAVFGHVRGAFTGATSDRKGYLAEAHGGTVLFDEIGGTGQSSQPKLLRAIETGTFRPVGAALDRMSDFRIVAAANEPLERLSREGRFRADLLHRLAGVTLHVPPLSARPGDIGILAEHFLRVMNLPNALLTSRAVTRLSECPWPGNVRELKHTVERAAILADGRDVQAEHVDQAIEGFVDVVSSAEVWGECAERRALLRALMESDWDTVAAAQVLGVHRATVYRRMRQFGLDSRQFSQADIRADSQTFLRMGANPRENAGIRKIEPASCQ